MAWSGKTDKATKDAQQIMADLDAVGNTTKAITKGVAIGSAVIAAVSLFGSFLVDVSRAQSSLGIPLAHQIQIDWYPRRHSADFCWYAHWWRSALAVLLFRNSGCDACCFLDCVGSSPPVQAGVLEGKIKPDYAQAVSISTTAAQKELVSLALLGIVTPIVVGLTLGVEALGGFLAGIIVSGQLLAVFLNNSGGAWDNAKKLIEDEPKDPSQEPW
jgi:K(+)-stimulated pyrophosphate-energized sodium pump